MAGNVPASHTFKGDGITRVFPISTRIIGDDYVRIEIDSEYIFDRKSWDIVNNSIIFTKAPTLNSTILIKVAESVEAVGLLDNQSTSDLIEANIPVINDVYNNLDVINNVNDNITIIKNVDNIKNDINTVSDNINNINTIANSLGDLQDIKNHNNLTGRGQEDAHPISAITGLQETLDGMSNDGGLFPTLTATHMTPDMYLSCKISPTQLKAIKASDIVLNPMYRKAYSEGKFNQIIKSDVYGTINIADTPSIFDVRDLLIVNTQFNMTYCKDVTNPLTKCPLERDAYYYYSTTAKVLYKTILPPSWASVSTIAIDIPAPYNNGTYQARPLLTNSSKLVFRPIGTSTSKYFLIYDLNKNTFSGIDVSAYTQSDLFGNGQLHPNGKIYYAPYNSTSIFIVDPEKLTYEIAGDYPPNGLNFSNSFLGTNGNIYFIPYKYKSIVEINPNTKMLTEYGNFTLNTSKFKSATIGVDGKIYMVMEAVADFNLYVFDPMTKYIDIKNMLSYIDKTTAKGVPNCVSMATGVDGNIYISCLTSSTNDWLYVGGIYNKICYYDPINDRLNMILSANVSSYFLGYTERGELHMGNQYMLNSNRGDNYWLMSNYFLRG